MRLWIVSCFLALNLCALAETRFQKVILATDLFEPTQLSIANDGSVYFAERNGNLKVWNPNTGRTSNLGQLSVYPGPEDGLLGLALDPGFHTNRWLYLFHSAHEPQENRVSRFTLADGKLDTNSARTLLHIPTLPKKPNHSGGGLGFDARGNLYCSTGDYTFISDSQGYAPLDERPGREVHDSQRTAANSNDPRGKILRIHPEADGTYTIPEGNLFPPGTPKTLPEIYIMGCRNPFRFTLNQKTGWLVWGDVGPDALTADPARGPAGFDEFNLAKQAGNFGWPYFHADNKPYRKFEPAHPINESPNNTGIRELPPAQPAFIWYPPGLSAKFPALGSGPRSAMAGPFYQFDRDSQSPRKFPREFDDALFLFDWERSWIGIARLDSESALKSLETFAPEIKTKRPISMSFGPDGALYLLEWGTAWSNNKDSILSRIEAVAQN